MGVTGIHSILDIGRGFPFYRKLIPKQNERVTEIKGAMKIP
jgi:hypothetical protein